MKGIFGSTRVPNGFFSGWISIKFRQASSTLRLVVARETGNSLSACSMKRPTASGTLVKPSNKGSRLTLGRRGLYCHWGLIIGLGMLGPIISTWTTPSFAWSVCATSLSNVVAAHNQLLSSLQPLRSSNGATFLRRHSSTSCHLAI